MTITIDDMTTREDVLKLVEELPESQLDHLIEFLKSFEHRGEAVHADERIATAEELDAFETEWGPFLPPDGEG